MKTKIIFNYMVAGFAIVAFSALFSMKVMAAGIREENVTFKAEGITFKGYIAYSDSIKGKRPVILVVPEWWGLNDYVKMRARQLAELGYLAMAVDVFGKGKTAANPAEAQELTAPIYKDPGLIKARLDAALARALEMPEADPSKTAAMGYCFGGFVVLNYAKEGADLKAVVSFHGGTGGIPVEKDKLKASILVCQGMSDKFVTVTDAEKFANQVDSVGGKCLLKIYPKATHAFTNPDATRIGKEFNMPIEYNAAADKNSWNDMKVFLEKAFSK